MDVPIINNVRAIGRVRRGGKLVAAVLVRIYDFHGPHAAEISDAERRRTAAFARGEVYEW